MDWAQVFTIIAANTAVVLPLFLWSRAESNADRRDLHQIIREIKDENKNFHARLSVLEERYLQILTSRKAKEEIT